MRRFPWVAPLVATIALAATAAAQTDPPAAEWSARQQRQRSTEPRAPDAPVAAAPGKQPWPTEKAEPIEDTKAARSSGSSRAAKPAKPADSAKPTKVTEPAKPGMPEVVVAGKELRTRVDTLARRLAWHESLAGAAKTAAELDRPIVWIQALGDLKGFT